MSELFKSPIFGIAISAAAFYAGTVAQKKTRLAVCNPLIIAIALVCGILFLLKIPYEHYNAGGQIITLFLSPATACLAVAIYAKIHILKKNWLPILVGCSFGSIASMLSVYCLCRIFSLDEIITQSILPKSVTTPIAVSIASSHKGITSITILSVLFSGLSGSMLSPLFIKILKIKDPITAGLSIGACSHAIGTSKALSIGETEGALSGLAIGICGFVTVLFSIVFYQLV
jgi:putative effector of murein hydrolase